MRTAAELHEYWYSGFSQYWLSQIYLTKSTPIGLAELAVVDGAYFLKYILYEG